MRNSTKLFLTDEEFQRGLDAQVEWERSKLRISDAELLRDVPDGIRIVRRKLREWEVEAQSIRETIKAKLAANKASAVDQVVEGFFRESVKVSEGVRLMHAKGQITRLWRLLPSRSMPAGTVTEAAIERALEVPIPDLIGSLTTLRRSGGRLCGCCPFHTERTASFTVYPSNTCWCFGCRNGGNSIKVIRLLYGCSFKQAIKQLLGGEYGK